MAQWQSQTRKMNRHYQSGTGAGLLKKFPQMKGIIRGGKIYLPPYDLYEDEATHGAYSYWSGRLGGYYKSITINDIINSTPLYAGLHSIASTSGTNLQSISVYDIGEITPNYATVHLTTNDAYSFNYYTGRFDGNDKIVTDGITKELSVAEGESDIGGIIVPTYHSYWVIRTQTLTTDDAPREVPDFAKDFQEIEMTDRQSFMISNYLSWNPTWPYSLDYIGALCPQILRVKKKLFFPDDEIMFWGGYENNGGYITGCKRWADNSSVTLSDASNVWGFGYRIAGEDAARQIPYINLWYFPVGASLVKEDGSSFSSPWGSNAYANAFFSNTNLAETPIDHLTQISVGINNIAVTDNNTTYGIGRMCVLTGLTFIDDFVRADRAGISS